METNPEKLLNDVEKAINIRPAHNNQIFHICYFDGEIRCLHPKHTSSPHRIFLNLSEGACQRGLTNATWENLLCRLAEFAKEENQCQNHPKP